MRHQGRTRQDSETGYTGEGTDRQGPWRSWELWRPWRCRELWRPWRSWELWRPWRCRELWRPWRSWEFWRPLRCRELWRPWRSWELWRPWRSWELRRPWQVIGQATPAGTLLPPQKKISLGKLGGIRSPPGLNRQDSTKQDRNALQGQTDRTGQPTGAKQTGTGQDSPQEQEALQG